MDALYKCLESASKHGYEKEYFWISGVFLVIVGLLGVIGNTLSLIVLSQRLFRKNAFFNLLNVMACFDLLFILSYGIKIGYQSMACRENYNAELGHITYIFMNLGLTGSIYSTVVVSFERCLSICLPHLKLCNNRVSIYIFAIVFVTFTFNVPIFFEYHYSIGNGMLVSEKFSWADSDTYKTSYHLWAALVIGSLLPLLALIFLNGAILTKLNLSRKDQTTKMNKNNEGRKRMTRILFGIVGMFMVCHTPCVVWKVLWHLGCIDCTATEDSEFKRKWFFITPIKKLFLTINSSFRT